jgi:hypothetical protein
MATLNQTPLSAQNSIITSPGGQLTALNLQAGANLIKAGQGRIFKIFVNTVGSAGTFSVNDSATTGGVAASNLIWDDGATTAVGTPLTLEAPYFNGLVVTVPTGGVCSVTYF